MTGLRPLRCWPLALLSLVIALRGDTASAATRIAIVATDPIEKIGLPELLLVELPKAGGLEMIERAEVEKLITEAAVQRMFAAGAVAERRSAGTLLKADLLLLLSRETIEARECLKVILAEPRTGSRLRMGLLPANAKPEESSREIARLTRETTARFATGAKTIIGVGPFLSRALVHDYDHLQTGLGNLLENALSSAPGVAVVEMEEADALRQEANFAGGAEVSRVVPLSVRGEFTVPPGPGSPAFSLNVEISDGARVLERIAPASLALPELARFVSGELPAKILSLAKSEAPRAFSPEAEFAALVARAEEFARTGASRLSTGLREAAVLLRDSDPQRKLLIREYCLLMQSSTRGIYREPFDRTLAAEAKGRALASWHAACRHLDFLTANRRIDAREYTELAERIRASEHTITGDDSGPVEEFQAERQRRLVAILPAVFDLPIAEGDRTRPHYIQQRLVTLTLPPLGYRKTELESLAEILERIPAETLLSGELTSFFAHAPDPSRAPSERISDSDWTAFLEKLQRSERPLNRIHARYGSLYGQHLSAKKNVSPELLAAVEALRAEYRAWCDERKIPADFRDPLESKLKDLAGYIKRDLAPAPVPVELAVPRQQPPTTTGRLQITELALQLKTLAGKTEPFGNQRWPVGTGSLPMLHLTRCNDRLDVFWSTGAILLHRTRGLLEEAVLDRGARFEDIAWDGAQLWIATRSSGVWRLDPDTRALLKVGPELGLPPADKGIRLHAISPGKVCAIGSFGEHGRAWGAIIDTQPQPAVKVFHTATRVVTAADDRKGDSARAADVVFSPAWVHLYENAQGERRLLVGRYGPSRASRVTPLEIDLDTLQVGICSFELTAADHRSSAAYFSSKGELLEAGDFSVAHISGDGKRQPPLCTPRNREGVANGGLRNLLLLSEGFIYVPGAMWFRIDARTLKAEQLTPDRLPAPGSDFRHFGVSAHFGVIGWKFGDPKYYQISVAESGTGETSSPR